MKICHIFSGDLWAGAEVQIYLMLTALQANNDITVQAISLNNGLLVDKLREAGVAVLVVDETKLSFAAIFRQIRQHLRTHPCDILHTHRYKENILGGLLKNSSGCRALVQTVHGLPEPFSGFAAIKSAITRGLNEVIKRRYVDQLVAVSEDIKKTLQELFPAERISVIRNSIDPNSMSIHTSNSALRNEFGIADDHILLGTVGRLVPVKAMEVFLHAAAEIVAAFPLASFIIVGDGPERKKLEELAGQLELGDKLLFTGFREDALDIVNAMDIFVMTSLHEGIPTALLEAMYLAKPVVVSAVGGLPEVVNTGASGVLVQDITPAAFAQACFKLIVNTEARIALGRAAHARIVSEFAISQNANALINLYRELSKTNE